MVANVKQEKAWQERVALWQASGLSQRAFAREHGFSPRQVSYWSRRLAVTQPAPGLVPVRVTSTDAAQAISLRSAQGWILTLPRDVPANWLAELMRAL